MTDGIWILSLVLQIGAHEIIIRDIAIYDDPTFGFYDCLWNKDDAEKLFKVQATCSREFNI